MTDMKPKPVYRYRAPSGVWVTSDQPWQEDPWAKSNLHYAWYSYRSILVTVFWKEPKRRRRLRKGGKA